MSDNSATQTGADDEPDQQLEAVIADYIRRCESGTPPNRREILEQHPELADELRQFFRQHDRMNQMAEPIRGFGDAMSQAIGPGQQLSYIGNYELLAEVARGGMGVVYKARQTTLGRIVAVKMIISGRLATDQDVQRFQIEAQAAAGLQHPNVVAIHEVGEHEGWHYFSMDFVEGRDLSAILRENLLPAKRAATYVRQMAEAIHYAHQQGILHRDLKPSNILIDQQDQVRITDFGLATRVEADQGLTQTGQILGTPSYMPPEQAQGKRSLIGPGSDVYSLGAILYECLTGRPPFRAESVIKTIEQVIHVGAASPRTLNPAIPRDLETICLKCLEKEPHRRYGTAQLLADDLGRYLDDCPILARPVSTIERTWRWCRRNPVVAGLLAAVAMCLIIGTAVSSYFAIEAGKRAKAEAFQRGRADDKAKLAERKSTELADALGKLGTEEKKVRAALNAETVAANELEKSNADLRDTIEREQEANYFNNVLLAWREWQAGHVLQAEKHLEKCRADLRSWEWHYIARLCQPTDSLAVLERVLGVGGKHDGLEPPGIHLSGDGTRIAYACGDRTVAVLDVSTGNELFRVVADVHDVSSVAISHDGGRLAALGKGRLTIWETSTMESRFTQGYTNDKYNRLEFSPDASRLIVSEQESRIVSREDGLRRWIVQNAKIIDSECLESLVSLNCCAYSQDGSRIATRLNNEVVVSQISDEKKVTLTRHDALVVSGVFSSDGTRIATFDIGSNIIVSDTATGERISEWNLRPDRIERIRFSPDGSKIATLSFLSNLKVWDATSGRLIRSFRESEIDRPNDVGMIGSAPYSDHRFFSFSPDSARLASASGNQKVTVWSLDSGKETALRTRELLRFVAFKAGGEQKVLYTTQIDPEPAIAPSHSFSVLKLNAWNLLREEESRLLYRPGAFFHTVAVNHASTRIASISKPVRGGLNSIKVWDTQSGGEVLSMPWEEGGQLFGVAFSPDDSLLAVAAGRNGIGIVDLTTREIRHVLWKNDTASHLVTFCQDGKRILVAHQGGAAIHNVHSGEAILRFEGGWVAAFNADETRVATGGPDGTVSIWNAATGENVLDLSVKETGRNMYCVAFSPDSSRLATADATGMILVWDAFSGKRLLELPAHIGRAYTVTYSPDGKRLISMGDDGVLRVWDSKSGREILKLTGHADRVYSATFTRDGSQIVSTSADGTIRIWDGRPIVEKDL